MDDVKSLESQRRRARLALGAGIFLVLLVGVVWVWVDRLFVRNSAALADLSTRQFLGRLNVAFAMVMIAGFLGIANGLLWVRSGRRNKLLVWAIVIVFISAFFTAY